MRRFILALPLLFAIPARAQALKIAYVDVQRAVGEVEEGKSIRAKLEQELQQKRADLDQKKQTLQKMQADYEKQAPVLSDDAKKKKQEELQKVYLEAQNSAQQMQQELQGKEQEALASIGKRLTQIVGEVSETEHFAFVLDKAALMYAPAASDITNEVVRKYNDRFGSGTGAKTADKKPGKK